MALLTNHFKVEVPLEGKIYIYHLNITPKIEADDRSKKRKIIDCIKTEIKEEIGEFVFTGFTIIAISNPRFEKSVELKSNVEDKNYNVEIKLIRYYLLSDIKNPEIRKSGPIMRFFNVLIKNYLEQLNYTQWGRDSKYLKMNEG